MGCSSCQQNNHVVPSTHVHNQTSQTHCECACGCEEPVCPTPQPCTEITDSKCIIYTDAAIKCGNDTVVAQDTSVSTALNQLAAYYCTQINEILAEYTYEIGQYVASRGGVIFHRYNDGTNENYLVIDTTDISTSSVWSNIDTLLIGTVAQSTWDGLSNSNAIVAQVGFTSGAANDCLISTNNSQTDWYLPTIDELSLLWQNRFNVNRTLSGNSSLGTIVGATQIGYNNYWCSTEYNANSAWGFNFFGGSVSNNPKNITYYVRAVRKFSL